MGQLGGLERKQLEGFGEVWDFQNGQTCLPFMKRQKQLVEGSRQANKYFWWNSVNKVCDCLSPDEAMRMLPYETKISSPALISFVALWCQTNKHTSTAKQGERKTVSQKCKIKLHNDKMFIVAYYEA